MDPAPTISAGEQLLPDPTSTAAQGLPRPGELSNPDAPLCGKTRRKILTRYDGVQKGLFESEHWHCYTIIDESSPALGASFTIAGDMPCEATIETAALKKELQFRAPTP